MYISPPRIAAVVVSYYPQVEALQRQLASLLKQVHRVVVVDNGSPPCTLDKLHAQAALRPDQLCVLALGVNTGVASAQNRGIEFARRAGATHVLLMDQDSLPAVGMVARLLAVLEQKTDIAAVGPRIFDPRTRTSLDCLKRGRFGYHRLPIPADGTAPIEVDHLISSGLLIPMSAVDALGAMDESLFIDAVDTEWCLRARAAGFRLMAEPRAELIHHLGQRSARLALGRRGRTVAFHSPQRQYYIFRNNILLCRRSYVGLAWCRRVALTLSRRALLYMICGPQRGRYAFEIFSGVLDAIRVRTGPHPDVCKDERHLPPPPTSSPPER